MVRLINRLASRSVGWQVHVLAGGTLLGILTFNLWWARPDYNWDLLPYVALAYQYSGQSPAQAHQSAYVIVQTTVPPRDFQQLKDGNTYRSTVASDARAFNQQLPGYRVKLVYPWLIKQLRSLGINPVRASVLISQLAYLAIGAVVMLWLSTWTKPVVAALASWGIMSQSFAMDLAQLSTPDAISTLIVLTALWLMFQTQQPIIALPLLVASVAIRPDNVFWLAAASGYSLVRQPAHRTVAVLSLALGAVLVVALSRWAEMPSWPTLFHHAFVERVAYQEEFQPVLSPFGYVRTYLRETHPAFLPLFLPLFGILGIGLLIHRFRRYGKDDRLVGLLATVALFCAMHWLLYPDDDRFFIPAYLAILIVLVQTLMFADGVPSMTLPISSELHARSQQTKNALEVDSQEFA